MAIKKMYEKKLIFLVKLSIKIEFILLDNQTNEHNKKKSELY